jgi:hypothetical protein
MKSAGDTDDYITACREPICQTGIMQYGETYATLKSGSAQDASALTMFVELAWLWDPRNGICRFIGGIIGVFLSSQDM